MKNNSIINFFASVKLALFLLFVLAVTSIIGTIIPQGKSADIYIKEFGEKTASLFQILDFTEMYSSWWFVTLLLLLCVNLIVCSLKRIPGALNITGDSNLEIDVDRLARRKDHKDLPTSLSNQEAGHKVAKALKGSGWKTREKQRNEGLLLFAQKGAWTRFGVYIVHSSILVIFVGAMIGNIYGYKGTMMIPETTTKGAIYSFDRQEEIELDFQILCKKFTLSRYPNGAPKEFISDLAVIEDGREVLTKTIEVNDPLHYKGHTFYQSSYRGLEKLLATIQNNQENIATKVLIDPGKEATWRESNVRFGVVNRAGTQEPGLFRYKVWFFDGSGQPQTFWITGGDTTTVKTENGSYTFGLKQFYATGLQVAKDPGVWTVYIGFFMMMGGLYVAFFLSHRRLWVLIKENGGTRVLISGNSNKNKSGFAQDFEETTRKVEKELQ